MADRVPLPDLGDRVPRRGNALTRLVGRAALRLMGWRLTGAFPNLPKYVIAVAPHTSNWDFVVGVLVRQATGMGAQFLGKHTLFRPPLGFVMRWFGGIPVRRDAGVGLVQQTVEAFRPREAFLLVVAPEGTRGAVAAWRTGFYYIALGAGVPISLVTIDYGRKEVVAGPVLVPSGDLEADLKTMHTFFEGRTPKRAAATAPRPSR